MSTLTHIIAWPLLAAVFLAFVPRNFKVVMPAVAIFATFVSALLAVKMFLQFKTGFAGYQFDQNIEWVREVGIHYHVGVDGINVGLVLMAAVVAFAAACW
jgi:NADH-quinone oxidoreductase subunit M